MNLKKNLLIPSIAGTTLMTLCSYAFSHAEKKNFSEPELLGRTEKRLVGISGNIAIPAGWATHYVVGFALTLLYSILKKQANIKPTFKTGIAFGALSGCCAILAWKLALKILPKRSSKFYNKYYGQLFLVHFVFAFTVLLMQNLMQKGQFKQRP